MHPYHFPGIYYSSSSNQSDHSQSSLNNDPSVWCRQRSAASARESSAATVRVIDVTFGFDRPAAQRAAVASNSLQSPLASSALLNTPRLNCQCYDTCPVRVNPREESATSMDNEKDEVLPLMQTMTEPVSSRTSMSTENHNHNKIRRRNVSESVNSAIKENDSPSAIDSCDRVPLVILPDSTKAWHDHVTPRIPDIPVPVTVSSKQQNGVLLHEDDRESSNEPGTVTEPLTNREKMKISVIRGSIANPDLILGELRLLGCSSEGFVNGIYFLPR